MFWFVLKKNPLSRQIWRGTELHRRFRQGTYFGILVLSLAVGSYRTFLLKMVKVKPSDGRNPCIKSEDDFCKSTCILWILLSPHIHPQRAARPARSLGLADWMGCWVLLGLLESAPSSFQCYYESPELNGIQKTLTLISFHHVWLINRGNSMKRHFTFVASLTSGNAAMVLSQFCISHFVGKKKHFNSLDIFVCTRNKMKTRHPKDHNTRMIAGCLWNLVHFCERSRRNGGRWWPQVRERWCGCIRNLPHAGDCVNLVQPISSSSIAL